MNYTLRLVIPWGVFVVVTVFSGCVSLEKGYPEKRYYVLDVSHPGETSSAANRSVLGVRKLLVSPRYEGKGLVYRRGDLSYESDFYNEFLISPSSLLTEEIRQWLAASGLFQHVVDPASHVQAGQILEGRVIALYGDYRDSGSPSAVLEIQFFLIDDVSARSEIIFRHQYRKEVAVGGNSTEALVKGWNQALQQILTSLETDLRATDLTPEQ